MADTTTSETTQVRSWQDRLPAAVAVVGGVFFVGFGLWALVAPQAFFDAVALFEPYNEHFLQDIGSFQIGLGAVLLLAAGPTRDNALATALLGVGAGTLFHTISHVIGRDLGGTPETDIPTFAILALALLVTGWMALRRPSG